MMKMMKLDNLFLWFVVATFFLTVTSPIIAGGTGKGITQNECALTKNAEIIWDLNKHLWVCCIPTGEGLEKCIPITDMKPLPKTSLKPLPPRETKTIIIEKNSSEE